MLPKNTTTCIVTTTFKHHMMQPNIIVHYFRLSIVFLYILYIRNRNRTANLVTEMTNKSKYICIAPLMNANSPKTEPTTAPIWRWHCQVGGGGLVVWVIPAGHTGIKEQILQTERRGVGLWQDGLLLLSVRQRTPTRARSQENRGWLIHGLTNRLCVEMCAFASVGLQDTQWMTDWQGRGWARLHRHRRLLRCVCPPFTHHSQLEESCDCSCLQLCSTVSLPVMVALF